MGHRDDGPHDRGIVGLLAKSVTNERSILMESSGKAPQVAERGIAGAEIVDG